jgi:ribonucleotide reductase beta subunit family protein with ferritin-like domain
MDQYISLSGDITTINVITDQVFADAQKNPLKVLKEFSKITDKEAKQIMT